MTAQSMMDSPPPPGDDPDVKTQGINGANWKHAVAPGTMEWLNMEMDTEDGRLSEAIAGRCTLFN